MTIENPQIPRTHNKPVLVYRDFELAAKALGCETASLLAVDAVESRGKGFLPDGQVLILFEGHIFSRLTNRKYDQSHPDISQRVWDRSHYRKDTYGEHERLQKAVALDRDAALMSASWGRFQLLGEGYGYYCGYRKLQNFITDMHRSEQAQLFAFCHFLKTKKDKQGTVLDALIAKDWHRFAHLYNGPNYKLNNYHTKLEDYYKRFKK